VDLGLIKAYPIIPLTRCMDPKWPEAKGYLALPQGSKFFQGEVKAEPLIRDVSFVIPVYRAKNHKNRDMIPF
jgi:hypothetical protein